MPNRASTTKIGRAPPSPRSVKQQDRKRRRTASSKLDSAMISRRPKRSATTPVTSTSSSAGRNWMMPTRPRSNGSRVRS